MKCTMMPTNLVPVPPAGHRSVASYFPQILQISLGVLCRLCVPCGRWLPLSSWQTGSWGEDARAVPVGSSSENTRQAQHDSNL